MTAENMFLNLWTGLGWPLIRLLFFISVGLMVANFIEALNWTRKLAFIAKPLTRFGHLSSLTGASFSMAFFSLLISKPQKNSSPQRTQSFKTF